MIVFNFVALHVPKPMSVHEEKSIFNGNAHLSPYIIHYNVFIRSITNTIKTLYFSFYFEEILIVSQSESHSKYINLKRISLVFLLCCKIYIIHTENTFFAFFLRKPSKSRIKWETFQGTIYLWPYWMFKIYMSHLSSPRFILQWHHGTAFVVHVWQ